MWVVDNASTDGSADMVRREAPWATLVEAGGNLGFGAAVDLVSERTHSPWLAAANADIELMPGALEALLAAGDQADVAVAAPRLVLPDGRTQHSVHPFPTLVFTVAFNLGLPALSRRLATAWCLEGSFDPERARRVPWAVGALLLVRREAFAQVGGFDAEQWMYAEDLDLCWRLAGAGCWTVYEPGAVVHHAESAATTAAFGPDRAGRFMAATYRVIGRRRGRAVAIATAAVNVSGAWVRVVLMAPLAAGSTRWAIRRADHRRWLTAHRAAMRALLTRRGRAAP